MKKERPEALDDQNEYRTGQPWTEWNGSPGHMISHGRQEESGCTINGIYVWFIWYCFTFFFFFFKFLDFYFLLVI